MPSSVSAHTQVCAVRGVALGCLVGFFVVRATAVALGSTPASISDMPGADVAAAPKEQRAANIADSTQNQSRLSGNPLWSIPIKDLSNTRDRPIFSPSRRPPPRVIAAPPSVVQPPPSKPKEPERPQLSLLGTIVNGSDGFGIFMDQARNAPVRVRVGAAYQGWTLRSIQSGAVTLERDQETAVLAFPKPANDPKSVLTRLSAATNAKLLSLTPATGLTGKIPTPPKSDTIPPTANPFMPRGDRP